VSPKIKDALTELLAVLLKINKTPKYNELIFNKLEFYLLKSKKEKEALHLKSDNFVVEGNVHFPTDYNLLWDRVKICFQFSKHIQNGLRKAKNDQMLSLVKN